MANRKNKISLLNKKLTFEFQNIEYRIISLCPNSMTVEIQAIAQNHDALSEVPFAHLSKELKKIIKPN